MSITLTGGSGILGTELQRIMDIYAPPRSVLDILDPVVPKCDLIVHAAAYTDVLGAETNKQLCYDTNVLGTRRLASLGIPMIYISTEYIFDGEKGNYVEHDYANPKNFYALTKLLGEYEARRAPRSCVIRCLFKPRPFKHKVACVDQFTTGDYVDVIAKEICLAISNFRLLPPTVHIGTERKSTYELAKRSRSEVGRIGIRDVKGVTLPRDTSLNCTLWNDLKREFRHD